MYYIGYISRPLYDRGGATNLIFLRAFLSGYVSQQQQQQQQGRAGTGSSMEEELRSESPPKQAGIGALRAEGAIDMPKKVLILRVHDTPASLPLIISSTVLIGSGEGALVPTVNPSIAALHAEIKVQHEPAGKTIVSGLDRVHI